VFERAFKEFGLPDAIRTDTARRRSAVSLPLERPRHASMSSVPSWLTGCVGPSASRLPQPSKPRAEREIPTGLGREISNPSNGISMETW
jgi:hypothetical protein